MQPLRKRLKQSKRKAISPVIATVILIAITLIASIAIAGFVFGLFGSFTSTAQISVIATSIAASSNDISVISTTATPVDAAICYGSTSQPTGAYIELSNSGTASASVTAVSITFGGQTYSMSSSTTTSTTCSVQPGKVLYVSLALQVYSLPGSGNQFVGSVTMSNGAQVPFSGAFQ
ncbi:MAG: type IV pilin N-terminal domain-containing protein [Thermoprotei archaeon]